MRTPRPALLSATTSTCRGPTRVRRPAVGPRKCAGSAAEIRPTRALDETVRPGRSLGGYTLPGSKRCKDERHSGQNRAFAQEDGILGAAQPRSASSTGSVTATTPTLPPGGTPRPSAERLEDIFRAHGQIRSSPQVSPDGRSSAPRVRNAPFAQPCRGRRSTRCSRSGRLPSFRRRSGSWTTRLGRVRELVERWADRTAAGQPAFPVLRRPGISNVIRDCLIAVLRLGRSDRSKALGSEDADYLIWSEWPCGSPSTPIHGRWDLRD